MIHWVREWYRRTFYSVGRVVLVRCPRQSRQYLKSLGFTDTSSLRKYERLHLHSSLGALLRRAGTNRYLVDKVAVRKTSGRFGNQVFQVAHALGVASELGSSVVYAPGNQAFPNISIKLSNGVTLDTRRDAVIQTPRQNLLWGILQGRRPENHLTGSFLSTRAFPSQAERFDYSEIFKLLRETQVWQTRENALDADHLVIHIRGGDVFKERPNPWYGQPPLSYYHLILQSARWRRVTVVSEDMANPVIAPLLETLVQKRVEHRFQSSTFHEDVSFLLRARTLVAGTGSFVPAIVGLSENAERLYVFGEPPKMRQDLEILRIDDVEGEYREGLCNRNWRAEDWQVELMTSYSIHSLAYSSLNPGQ